jgi:hypothetical protein
MSGQTCQNETAGTGRAVAVIAPATPRPAAPPSPLPPLVAQLLALRLDLPQSRARRRAAPERGSAIYAARLDLRTAPPPMLVQRLA